MSLYRTRDSFATLLEVGQLVNSSLDLDQVLEIVMDTVIRVTGAERGILSLLVPDTGDLTVRVARDLDHGLVSGSTFEVSENLLRQVARSGEPVLTADASMDGELKQFQSVAIYGLRSVLCVPLQARGRVIGVIYVDNRLDRGVFTNEDLNLLVAFANQAALAIDNARLYSGLQSAKAYQDSIFASVASGVLTLDLRGLVQAFNPAAERIFGRRANEAVGRPYTEILSNSLVARLIRPMLAMFAGDEWVGIAPIEVTTTLPHQPVCHLSVRLTPLRGLNGEITGAVITVDDVTEQRRADEARRRAEEAHRRVRQVFGQFLAPTLVDRFVADPSRLRMPGVRQEVTVLFADLRGYTTLAEQLAPEKVVELLNRFLAIAVNEVQATGGYLDSFLGDAVMAIYNVPERTDRHARQAVLAAVRLQERLAEIAGALPVGLHAGVGVNTGQAVVGTIGPEQAMSFTAIGDAVNVAQRLQTAAAGGEVLISAATYDRVGDIVDVDPVESLTVKGRLQPVETYRVRALRRA